ncbi:MAG TPA: O-antigen ligase family protein [Candidatus Sulfotelmatobacter sp.]|nr:O-antigen ligase family protein [Candidatus Sulfotelmatobacter sp.]
MGASSQSMALAGWEQKFASGIIKLALWPAHLLVTAPCLLFLLALTAMLLRHPDLQFYAIDRVAFGLLLVGVIARAVLLRQKLFLWHKASWPMAGLTLLALASVAGRSFDHETWSLLASKILVPFAMFHLAGTVFTEESHFRYFERFSIAILAYLSFTAIAFLAGAQSLIFPRFILDESLGFHADRARGPLLQAVANGVSLNILGLIALHAYRRRTMNRFNLGVLLATLPVAILATMTRAVWLSFAGTIIVLVLSSKDRKLRWRAFFAGTAILLIGLATIAGSGSFADSLSDRMEERGPVDFRQAVYAGGWEMFWDRPWLGWGFHQMPAELPKYVSGYREKILYPHNTYLELLVEEGVLGLSLYAWLVWELWRLGRSWTPEHGAEGFLNRDFKILWLILLAVYWVNAAVVVMSYQFVNALVFTIGGMLAAQRYRTETLAAC